MVEFGEKEERIEVPAQLRAQLFRRGSARVLSTCCLERKAQLKVYIEAMMPAMPRALDMHFQALGADRKANSTSFPL